MVIGSVDECDPSYVPPRTLTPTRDTHTSKAMLTKVAPDRVISSQYEEERIQIATPSGSAAQSEGASGSEDASGSEEVSGYEEVSGSKEASALATASQSASSDENDSVDSTPHPRLAFAPLLLISPTGGMLKGNIKYKPTPSCRMTRGS